MVEVAASLRAAYTAVRRILSRVPTPNNESVLEGYHAHVLEYGVEFSVHAFFWYWLMPYLMSRKVCREIFAVHTQKYIQCSLVRIGHSAVVKCDYPFSALTELLRFHCRHRQ